jgi:hypothetical protein
LNISLENKEKGELKNLLDGFNLMTNELKKNQSELAELERKQLGKKWQSKWRMKLKSSDFNKAFIQQLTASFRDKNKKI